MVRSLINQNCAKSSQHLHQSNIAEKYLVFICSIPILVKLGELKYSTKKDFMATESEISGRSVKACRMFKNAIMYLSEFIADRLIANSTPNLPLLPTTRSSTT